MIARPVHMGRHSTLTKMGANQMSRETSVSLDRTKSFAIRVLATWLTALLLSTPAMHDALAAPKTVVVLGDSLSAGHGLGPGEGFPERLGEALDKAGLDVRIVNAGVSGDTSAAGLARLDWSVPTGTDGVIVELGGNDALRGVPPESTRNNLDAIITRLKEQGIAVLLTGMLAPPNMGEAYGAEFDSIFEELARKHAVSFYPFILDGVAAVEGLNQADGIHPNKAGIAKMVENILPTVIAFMESIPERGTTRSSTN